MITKHFQHPSDEKFAEAVKTVAEIYNIPVEEARKLLEDFVNDLVDQLDRELVDEDYDRAMKGI